MNSNNSTTLNIRNYAIIAGTALLTMAFTAIFAYAVVFNQLVVPTDATTTFMNISSAYGLYNTGIAAWFIILFMDLLVTWSLYFFFKPVDQPLSLLSSGLRMAYTLFLGIGLFYQLLASQLVGDSLKNTLLNTTTLQNEVLQRLMTFESLWSFGLILFGLHLIVLGLLALKSSTVLSGLAYCYSLLALLTCLYMV